mmetsp:Transcript_12544/g.16083  ORF Transcript_12544/g.16083 Transcript_12544/m.16083 type:complete len:80 (+) Transcript_12544:1071-1310(+)
MTPSPGGFARKGACFGSRIPFLGLLQSIFSRCLTTGSSADFETKACWVLGASLPKVSSVEASCFDEQHDKKLVKENENI